MFEAKLLQVGLLKKILDAVKDLVSAANFDCTNVGFGLHAMDSSHIALCSVLLREAAFEHFRCDKNRSLGKQILMGNADLTPDLACIRCCDNNEIVHIRAEDGQNKVFFSMENPENRRLSKFEMSLLEIDAEELTIPETKYTVSVSLPSAEFSRVIRDLSGIGDSILISVSERGITFSTAGDIGNAEITLTPNTSGDMLSDDISIQMDAPVSFPFAAKYLNSFTKAAPLSDQVVLRLDDGQPLAVTYPIGDKGHLTYFLAPKIQDDDTMYDEEE